MVRNAPNTRRLLCKHYGHIPLRIEPGDSELPWRWLCKRCDQWLDELECNHEWTDNDPLLFNRGLIRCRQCAMIKKK